VQSKVTQLLRIIFEMFILVKTIKHISIQSDG